MGCLRALRILGFERGFNIGIYKTYFRKVLRFCRVLHGSIKVFRY